MFLVLDGRRKYMQRTPAKDGKCLDFILSVLIKQLKIVSYHPQASQENVGQFHQGPQISQECAWHILPNSVVADQQQLQIVDKKPY